MRQKHLNPKTRLWLNDTPKMIEENIPIKEYITS